MVETFSTIKRGQEAYGEDPFLTAKLGTAFIRGSQGNDPKYLLWLFFFILRRVVVKEKEIDLS